MAVELSRGLGLTVGEAAAAFVQKPPCQHSARQIQGATFLSDAHTPIRAARALSEAARTAALLP